MDPHLSKLICGIVDDYFAARAPVRSNPKLVRGIARITSSLAEERLADYLVGKFQSISRIYIDQGINIDGERLHKPDLVICVGNDIRVLVDVKMDLGYMRPHFNEIANRAHNFIDIARRSEKCTARIRVYEENKKIISLKIPNYIHQVFFIVSGGNIPQKQFASEISKAEKFKNISITTLFPSDHANDQHRSRDETVANLFKSVDLNALQRFDALIQRLCGANG